VCQKSLQLPESDIVYGEYTAPSVARLKKAKSATYDMGTAASPLITLTRVRSTHHGLSSLTSTCSVSLLRGAVPVGAKETSSGSKPKLFD